MGIASLVLGILSILLSVCTGGLLSSYMVIVAIIGLILGAVGKNKQSSLSTGGLVCSIIGLVISVLMFASCMACINEVDKEAEEVGKAMSEYEEDINRMLE